MPSGGKEIPTLHEIWAILLLSARHNLARWQRTKQGRLSALWIKGASISSKFCVRQVAHVLLRFEFINRGAPELCRVVEHDIWQFAGLLDKTPQQLGIITYSALCRARHKGFFLLAKSRPRSPKLHSREGYTGAADLAARVVTVTRTSAGLPRPP